MLLRSAGLLLLVAIVFGRAAGHEFVNFDDDKFLYANERITSPTLEALADHWRQPHGHLYVPVTMTAWWLVAQVGAGADAGQAALNPWLFHGASLIVHAANVLLVRRIVRAVVHDDRAAFIAAAVFAIHPLQTESVAWASELKDLLAGMFGLLAIASALLAESRRRGSWWLAAAGCYAAAMLSKPSAVTLPLIAATVLWMVAAPRKSLAAVLLIGFALALPVALVARRCQPALEVPAAPPWLRPLVAADALAFYAAKLVWPAGLAVDYGRTPAFIVASNAARWSWIVPAALTAAVLFSRRRALVGGWIIFLAGVTPNLGLLPFDFQVVSTVADHYVYVSMLGIAIMVADAVAITLSRWALPAAALAAIVLIALGAASFVQAGRWRDSYALWRRAIDINPRSGLAHVNLGSAMLSDGDARGAIPLLDRAADIDPDDPFAHLNLTRARLAVGDTAGAAQSALEMASAYRRRADFKPELTASVLELFAANAAKLGDDRSADRLRTEARKLRQP